MNPGPMPALVLAGSRGEGDPLASGLGVAHRALLPVAGTPMLLRVVRTLRALPGVGRVVVSIDEPRALDAVDELEGVAAHTSLSSPSRSVADLLGREGTPALVTTADHALLTGEIAEHFAREAERSGADLAVGLVERSVVEARFPGVPRTWLRLRDRDVTGANLFLFRTPASRAAADFWVRAESFRKRPWRLAAALGPWTLLRFAARRLSLADAFAHLSRATGARVEPVLLPFAEAAVDIDRPSDLALAEQVLRG